MRQETAARDSEEEDCVKQIRFQTFQMFYEQVKQINTLISPR